MSKAIREHIRSNVIGYIAIFMFAIGGTAYATHPGGADTISSGDIINDNVNSADVRDDTQPNGGLQAVDLRADSVGSSEIAPNSLDATDLSASSVTSSEIATGAIPADGTIFGDGSTKLAAGSVDSSELEVDSVTSSELGSNSVRQDEIFLDSVGSSEIQNNAITTSEVANSIPAVRVTRTVGQGIPRNTVTTLNFNAERYDTANMHSNTTNLSRLTAPVSGIYAVTAQVRWDATGSGFRCLDLRRSGAEVVAAQCWDAPIIVDPDMNVSTMLRLAAGDFVEARALQSCCDTLPILKGTAFSPEFSMTWLAPGP